MASARMMIPTLYRILFVIRTVIYPGVWGFTYVCLFLLHPLAPNGVMTAARPIIPLLCLTLFLLHCPFPHHVHHHLLCRKLPVGPSDHGTKCLLPLSPPLSQLKAPASQSLNDGPMNPSRQSLCCLLFLRRRPPLRRRHPTPPLHHPRCYDRGQR